MPYLNCIEIIVGNGAWTSPVADGTRCTRWTWCHQQGRTTPPLGYKKGKFSIWNIPFYTRRVYEKFISKDIKCQIIFITYSMLYLILKFESIFGNGSISCCKQLDHFIQLFQTICHSAFKR